MSIQSITSISTQTPQELSIAEFNNLIPAPTEGVHSQVCDYTSKGSQVPITIPNIDGIVVFEVEKFKDKIRGIRAYHYKNETGDKTIANDLDYSVLEGYNYEYFLIGGKNASENLLKNIVFAIHKVIWNELNSKSTFIINKYLNPIRVSTLPTLQFVTASLDLSGKLRYCLHNNNFYQEKVTTD